MALTDYITEDHILTDFRAVGKPEALESLCRFAASLRGLDQGPVLQVVLEREELGSTGLGGGVAIPHGKSPLVKTPLLILAVAPDGVDFDSIDGQPVRVFVLMLTPQDGDAREHLQLLARLGAIFKSQSAVEEFLTARTPAEARAVLARRD